jgi:23S rRNA pseudouridine2604 synthase
MEENLKRLNKFIGETGIAPVEKLTNLLMKDVSPKRSCSELGTKVSPHDEVRIDGKLVREKMRSPSTWLL